MTKTPENPFQAFLDQSADWTKEMAPHMERFMGGNWSSAEWMQGMEKAMGAMSKEMLDATMGGTASAGGLDAQTSLLVSLAGFVAQGATADAKIKITVSNAHTAGATEQEIMETIATMSLLGGMPAMTKAMQLAADALKEKDNTE